MRPCKGCKRLLDRKEAKENDGLCRTCAKSQADERKVSSDLLTSFSGKGVRGFVQWLKMGKFLQVIRDEAEVNWYNDRVAVIMAMVGEDRFDRLVDEVAKAIVGMAKEEDD